MMSVEQLMEQLPGETELLGKTFPIAALSTNPT
jgi:hypothetical protein